MRKASPGRFSRGTIIAAIIAAAAHLGGCASVALDHAPLTEALSETAVVPGYPTRIRSWGDELPEDVVEIIRRRFDQVAARPELAANASGEQTAHLLALSGGADDGAYGAGLLVGWTAAGTRPRFELVSGISTGALIAPFAFLGPDYDDQLREVYTTLSSDKIFLISVFDAINGAIRGASLADTRPLRKQIETYYTQDMLDAIAREHRKGRRLLVGTTNLEAQRPVIWDIGAIADSGQPDRLKLFHDVVLASASIPGVFPPVLIEVTANGRRHTEIHVDGGVSNQVFIYPTQLDGEIFRQAGGLPKDKRLWVIRNTKVLPEFEPMRPRFLDIAGRSVSSLIKSHGFGDIFRLYVMAKRDGFDFNLTFVPDEFDVVSNELFDPVYMKALFDLGYARAFSEDTWRKTPPGVPAGTADRAARDPDAPPRTARAAASDQ